MQLKSVIGLGLLVVSLGLAQRGTAASWSHISLKGDDKTAISIDYQINEYEYHAAKIFVAKPIWINIRGQNLQSSARIRVVFLNYVIDPQPKYSPYPERVTIDLQNVGPGHFTGQVPYGLMTSVHNRQQEIAVVVDGVWLKDPVSSGSNFQFNLYRSR